MSYRRTIAAAVGVLLAVTVASSAQAADRSRPNWVGAWATAVQQPSGTTFMGYNWSLDGFANQSVRQVVRVSTGGTQVRVRLSNAYGARPLRIAGATVALAGPSGSVRPHTLRPLTFGHRTRVTLAAGAQLASDATWLTTSPLDKLSITLYFADPTGPATFHEAGMATTYRATGDHRYDPSSTAFNETTNSWYYLSGVDVAGRHGRRDGVVVAFGDSITDGVTAGRDSDNRYPDELAERLVAARRPLSVLNAGISGNRVLNDSSCFGEKAVTRFERDALNQPRVQTVIVLEGINDIGYPYLPMDCTMPNPAVSAGEIIAGHQALIRAAHARGVRIIGATITPYKGFFYYNEEGEAIRNAVNRWIRTSGEYDLVLDFDRVLADPEHPDQMLAEFSQGSDGLHPNEAGLRAMANAVDLNSL